MFRNGFDGRILWLKTFNKEGNKGNKALVNPYVQNMSNTYFMSNSRSNLMTWNWHEGTFQLHTPPSLTLQQGVGGRWKPNHSNLTPVDNPKSPKLMDLCQQVGSVNVQTPDEISESQAFDFPPIQWKNAWSAAAWSSDSLHCRLDGQRLWIFSQRFLGSKDRWQELIYIVKNDLATMWSLNLGGPCGHTQTYIERMCSFFCAMNPVSTFHVVNVFAMAYKSPRRRQAVAGFWM